MPVLQRGFRFDRLVDLIARASKVQSLDCEAMARAVRSRWRVENRPASSAWAGESRVVFERLDWFSLFGAVRHPDRRDSLADAGPSDRVRARMPAFRRGCMIFPTLAEPG